MAPSQVILATAETTLGLFRFGAAGPLYRATAMEGIAGLRDSAI